MLGGLKLQAAFIRQYGLREGLKVGGEWINTNHLVEQLAISMLALAGKDNKLGAEHVEVGYLSSGDYTIRMSNTRNARFVDDLVHAEPKNNIKIKVQELSREGQRNILVDHILGKGITSYVTAQEIQTVWLADGKPQNLKAPEFLHALSSYCNLLRVLNSALKLQLAEKQYQF